MARRRLRVTGFTRFLLFLIIVTPLAYFGILYAKGEPLPSSFQEVVQNLKRDITKASDDIKEARQETSKPEPSQNVNTSSNKNTQEQATSTSSRNCEELAIELEDLEDRYIRKSDKVDELQEEVESLKKQIEFLQKGE